MVLLVNQHTVPVFLDIVNAYAERGHRCTLFTGFVERGASDPSPAVSIRKSVRYNRKSSLTRFMTWIAFTTHYFFYLLICRKPEFIIVSTNPPLAPLVTALVAGVRGIPYYIVLYDLYPEALSQAGLVRNDNLIFRIWRRINPGVFRKAKKVFTLSESMKIAAARYADEAQLQVIHNWADTSYIHPVPKEENSFVARHGLSDKFVVLYSGNMGLTHDLESLVGAALLLRDEPNLTFVLIGDGGKRKRLEELAREHSATNVMFLPFQDEKNFPLAMAAADVGVVTLGTGAEGISVPSKTYVNMAAGLCLLSIAPLASELNRIVSEHEAGFVCEPGRPDEVAGIIRMLLYDNEKLQYHRQRSLEAASLFTPRNASRYVDATSELSTATA